MGVVAEEAAVMGAVMMMEAIAEAIAGLVMVRRVGAGEEEGAPTGKTALAAVAAVKEEMEGVVVATTTTVGCRNLCRRRHRRRRLSPHHINLPPPPPQRLQQRRWQKQQTANPNIPTTLTTTSRPFFNGRVLQSKCGGRWWSAVSCAVAGGLCLARSGLTCA